MVSNKKASLVDDFQAFLQKTVGYKRLTPDSYKLWISNKVDYPADFDDIILRVQAPYWFVAEKLGIEVNVYVWPLPQEQRYVITYGRLVLEERSFKIDNFCWSKKEFERWVARTKKAWLKVLPVAKLLLS
jgi:hypothetical protein